MAPWASVTVRLVYRASADLDETGHRGEGELDLAAPGTEREMRAEGKLEKEVKLPEPE